MTDPNSQDRPSTSASSPRYFWVGMAVFLIVMVLLGFGSTYGRQLVLGKEISGAGVVETDWVVHLHAAIFVGWMILLLTQTIFAARGQIRAHMSLGAYGGLALGATVVLVGGLITYVQAQALLSDGFGSPTVLLITMQGWWALIGFIILFGLGLRYRSQPAVHKRYVTLATIMLVTAATSRMGYLLGPWKNTIGFALLLAPLYGYDLYTERRVRSSTLLGTGFVGVLLVIEYVVAHLFG